MHVKAVSYLGRGLQTLEGGCENLDIARGKRSLGCHVVVAQGCFDEDVGIRVCGRRKVEEESCGRDNGEML